MNDGTDRSAHDAVELADTIGTALLQIMRMHLVISDIRVQYWMAIALGLAFGGVSLTSVSYGMAWLALGLPGRAGLEPVPMVLIGGAVLLATLLLVVQRTSVCSVTLRTMRREVAILEAMTEEARQEARSIGMAGA